MSEDLVAVLDRLRSAPHETSVVEFKSNLNDPDQIGEYVSALANTAALEQRDRAWLVWGVEDGTHKVIGTSFDPWSAKVRGQSLLLWLRQMTEKAADCTLHRVDHPDGCVVMLEIHPARGVPVTFNGKRWIRVDSHKTKLDPQRESRLWAILSTKKTDWTGEVVAGATLDDLDPDAVNFARDRFIDYLIRSEADPSRHDRVREEARSWDVSTLLNKAKVTKGGRVTRAALLLLGRDESSHLLAPVDAKISWILRDADNNMLSSQHFGMPFLTSTERVFGKIRNVYLEQLAGKSSLFPTAVLQYEPWVIREALHNCIAHQDYELGGKINVIEHPDRLVFTNLGSFLPPSIDWMIEHQSPMEHYRNQWLVDGMIRLRMIDQVGSGIRKMFEWQRERGFPMPDFEIDRHDRPRVEVVVHGKILDPNYTRLLVQWSGPAVNLRSALLLDRVQKRREITPDEAKELRAAGLIEGRSPNYVITLPGTSGHAKASKALPDDQLHALVIDFLTRNGRASRKELQELLSEQLPSNLDEKQKDNKIKNLLQSMRLEKKIENLGSRSAPDWRLVPP